LSIFGLPSIAIIVEGVAGFREGDAADSGGAVDAVVLSLNVHDAGFHGLCLQVFYTGSLGCGEWYETRSQEPESRNRKGSERAGLKPGAYIIDGRIEAA